MCHCCFGKLPQNWEPEEKKRDGKICHGTAFIRLCLPKASFWLQGKLRLCWTDNQQQRKMTSITVSQPYQGMGGQAPSLTWLSKCPALSSLLGGIVQARAQLWNMAFHLWLGVHIVPSGVMAQSKHSASWQTPARQRVIEWHCQAGKH